MLYILLTMLADIIIFNTGYDLIKIMFLIVGFTGGIILMLSRHKHPNIKHHIPIWKKLLIILKLSMISTAMLVIYKKGMQIQPNIFFHISFLHILLFLLFFIIGGKKLCACLKDKAIPIFYIVAITTLVTISAIASSFAILNLLLTTIILFTLIRACSFAFHDIYTKDIILTKINLLSIALILVSMIFITYMESL